MGGIVIKSTALTIHCRSPADFGVRLRPQGSVAALSSPLWPRRFRSPTSTGNPKNRGAFERRSISDAGQPSRGRRAARSAWRRNEDAGAQSGTGIESFFGKAPADSAEDDERVEVDPRMVGRPRNHDLDLVGACARPGELVDELAELRC